MLKFKSKVLESVPTLKQLIDAPHLCAYVAPAINWKINETIFPYAGILRTTIIHEVHRLYGNDVAKSIETNFQKCFCLETGAHQSLPRTLDKVSQDTPSDDNVNTLVFQGLIFSAAIHHSYGATHHLTMGTGRIPPDNANSAAYLQLQDNQFLRLISNKYKNCPQMFIPAITDECLNDFIKKTNHYDLKNRNKEATINALNNMKNKNSFSDQVVSANSVLMTEVLSGTKIKQINIEYEAIMVGIISQMLRDSKTTLYKIFNDPVLTKKFIRVFSKISTGWSEEQTPFDTVYEKKGVKRIGQNYDGNLSAEHLAQKLEEGTILPKGLLVFYAFIVEAGLLPLGGMFQTSYCTAIKERAVPFLANIECEARISSIASMPTHIATLSPIWGIRKDLPYNGNLISYGDVLSGEWQLTDNDVKKIMRISGEDALTAGSLILYNFLFDADKMTQEDKKNITRKLNKDVFIAKPCSKQID